MQSLLHQAKRPGFNLVQQAPTIVNLILQRAIHCICLLLHWSLDVQKPSYHLLTIKQSPQENLRSYVQRFNVESLKVDIPDEKFAITSFIVGLGVQSKDLMFSISKNPQASMAEVLAKAEKYINDEEALLSKRENSSVQKKKSRGKKKRERSPRRRGDRDRFP